MSTVPHHLEAIEYLCNRLCERRVTLFLGAGINYGLLNNQGIPCPLGQTLSDMICSDLLGSLDLHINLEEATEIAIHKIGKRELNQYLYKLLTSYTPGPAHLALVQLPWDSIFTTNYDLLVEKAQSAPSVTAAGAIRPIFSLMTDLSSFVENDTGAPFEQQVDHFEALAEKELLVALRELATQTSFDDIIRDEYNRIPTPAGQKAYLYVSALGQLDLPIRFETLQHLLSIDFAEFGNQVLKPTEGVLLSLEDYGQSRHNAGFRIRTRHPVIASVIFATGANDDTKKYEIINAIIGELDPGYPDDARLLEGITRKKALVGTLASPTLKRAVYERLEVVLPNSPYVLQHRSILERELNNGDSAIDFARRALALEPRNPALQNTLGFALEYAARSSSPLSRNAQLAEASKLFDECIQRSQLDAFAYLGKVVVLRHKFDAPNSRETRNLIHAEILSVLEEGYEATNENPVLAAELAKQREMMGSTDAAIEILNEALSRKPSDERLRSLLVRLETERGKLNDALKIATQGEKYDPTAWRIQRQIARLKRELGHPIAAIKGYYDAALRHNQGDPGLIAEYGAFLFINNLHSEASDVFAKGRQLNVSSAERNLIRGWWMHNASSRHVFSGKVAEVRGGLAIAMAIPENFHVQFWRTRNPRSANLKQGDPIKFIVGFSASGPRAEPHF